MFTLVDHRNLVTFSTLIHLLIVTLFFFIFSLHIKRIVTYLSVGLVYVNFSNLVGCSEQAGLRSKCTDYKADKKAK